MVVERYNGSSLGRDLVRPYVQIVMWLYGKELIKVSYHSARVAGLRRSVSGDIMLLVCHVILT